MRQTNTEEVHISTILSIHEFECATYTDGMCREHITPGAFKLVVDDDEVIRVYVVDEYLCFLEHDGDTYLFNSDELAEYLTSVLDADKEDE